MELRPQRVKKVIINVEVYQITLHSKPPLCKGRWAAVRRLGGIVRYNL